MTSASPPLPTFNSIPPAISQFPAPLQRLDFTGCIVDTTGPVLQHQQRQHFSGPQSAPSECSLLPAALSSPPLRSYYSFIIYT
ncbi:unnamed protein product [Protopolystoma xenopodis]|uniref:Uncharacterized protein n=1 Tax=Protopolystoma xenopodis TaxID=117903 RepID=A0A3S5FH77_9PLAT|nr:unnamed protein product [Protopolystoma xenopodis]